MSEGVSSKVGLPLGGEYCTEVQSIDADGLELRVGDVITYRNGGYEPLLTGCIASLWREDHPNVGGPRFFAEIDGGQRMWLNRDRPRLAEGLEADFGARVEGALW